MSLNHFFVFLLATVAALSAQEPKVPTSLHQPAGQSLVLSVIGRGNQIYVCGNSDGAYGWKLKAPDAKLIDAAGQTVGHHSAGPAWESTDGSRVVGKLVASVASSDPQSIPWLLLSAASHEGSGVMNKVETIQRLETQAGMAPTIACGDANKGERVMVPYQARYNFYGTP